MSYSRSDRMVFEKEGRCVTCGRPNDRLKEGYATCSICASIGRKSYYFRKNNNLCVHCGEPTDGTTRCERCKEMNRKNKKEEYWFLRNMGVCVSCRTHSAAPGKAKCEVCLQKDAQKYKERLKRSNNELRKENHREYMRNRRIKARENGMCVTCFNRKAVPGRKVCVECATKNRRKLTERRRAQGSISYTTAIENGLCTNCRRERAMHGKLCQTCYERMMANLELAKNAPKTIEYRKRMHRENEYIFLSARGT